MSCDLLLIDGKHALWRAADAHNDLRIEEQRTGAIYGFLQILCKAHQNFGGNVIICWDDWKDGPARRKEMFADYKLRKSSGSVLDDQRAEFVKSMHAQHIQLMDLLEVFGIYQTFSPGWEADDVIGTLARRFAGQNVSILSGDRDLLQLVTETTTLHRPRPGGEYIVETPETVFKEWGVRVHQFTDLKALMGDKGDNIPGCPGIGPVQAAKILQTYDDLDVALKAAFLGGEFWKLSEKLREKLSAHEEVIRLSKRLAQINTSVPVKARPRTPDRQRAVETMVKMKFKSILLGGRFEQLLSLGA